MAASKKKPKLPEPVGGGWFKLADGNKVQGRTAAYKAAGLDPKKHGNRRSDAAKQRRRSVAIAKRRRSVAVGLIGRVPYRDIAEALEVSLATVAEDAAAVMEEWKEGVVRDLEDYVVAELAALDHDERNLREALAAAYDPDVAVKLYDRIFRLRVRRFEILGLNPPEVRQVAITVDAHHEHEVVFRAGGTDDEYLETIRAAQGRGKVIDIG